jgi:hypothetical protein
LVWLVNRNAARIVGVNVFTFWHIAGAYNVHGATARVALHVMGEIRITRHDLFKATQSATLAIRGSI